MTLPNLQNNRSIAVHADELEEQGDPRAELVRAQLAGHDGHELIAQHWSQWVGSLSPKQALLRWELGHVIEAALGGAPPDWRLADLLERKAARFLRRLAVGPLAKMSLIGIERLESLRELVLLTPSSAALAELAGGLETLTIDLQAEDPEPLSFARLPRLTTLHTRCLAGSEEGLFRAAAKASWWSSLTKWTHRVRTLQGLEALRVCGPLLERGGRGLMVFCEAPVLAQVPEPLRRALPHAEFALLPIPTQPRDPEDSHGPSDISVTPLEAPMHFRSLPPRTHTSEPNAQSDEPASVYVGSGVRFTELDWSRTHFSRCGWCYAKDTSCINEQRWSLYSHFETTRYTRWEYECPHCGLFTHSRCSSTH